MKKLFEPESILVVGVSPSPRNMARNIVQNLIQYEFPGRLHLMGRKSGNVAGQPIHTDFSKIPDGIDLAVFLTPAELLPALVDKCGEKGIRWLAIESGGFSEMADERRSLDEAVLAAANKWGIRFVGPNGLGIISRANGTVVPFMRMPYLPPPGRVSLVAQSGGVGIVYLHALGAESMGLDKFVSMGNKLSLDECDFIEYIGSDGTSDVICVYLEDVRRGRRFFEALCGFPGKVVIQKANVSKAGAAAARSHTASLSTDDRLVDAVVRQAGAQRVEDMTTMVHFAMGMTLPPVKGNRMLILSRSGGHAVIAADYAERAGFELPELPAKIAGIASAAGRAHVIRSANPLDLGDVFDFERYARMLELAVRGDQFDAVAVIHVYSSTLEAETSRQLYEAAARLTRETGKPVFVCFLTEPGEQERLRSALQFPLFGSPEILMEAMAASRNHYRVRQRIQHDSYPAPPPMDLAGIREVLEQAREEACGEESDRHWLGAEAVFRLANLAGFPMASFAVVRSPEEAAVAGARIGYPVAMKVLSPDLLHKSRGGGVSLNVKGDEAAQDEFEHLRQGLEQAVPDALFKGVLVQKMVRGFREVFLGGRHDPSFGPVVAVGFGGVYVEVLDDISVRLCPVSTGDVREMLSEVSLFRAFKGPGGEPSADMLFLEQCVHRLSHLLVSFPEIIEIDLNPMKLFDAGHSGLFVDGRVAIVP